MQFTQTYSAKIDGRFQTHTRTFDSALSKEDIIAEFNEFSKTAKAKEYDSVESQFASLMTRRMSDESGLTLGDDVHCAILEIISTLGTK